MKIRVGLIITIFVLVLIGNVFAESNVKDVYTSVSCTWIVMNDGEVYASGANEYGQLGMGHTNIVLTPTKINGLLNVKEVFSHNNVSVYYLTNDGDVYVTGNNSNGELGVGNTNNVLKPTKIQVLSDVVSIVFDDVYTYFLTRSGEVYCTGNNVLSPTKVTVLPRIEKIVSCNGNTFYLTEDGEVYANGNNLKGQLGLGHEKIVKTPTKVNNIPSVKEIIACKENVYFLTNTREVYVSGWNVNGEIGIGYTNNVNIPTKLFNIYGIKDVVVDSSSAYFLTDEGEVYVTGNNGIGQLGVGHTSNVRIAEKIPNLNGIEEIITCDGSTFFLTENGEIYACGYNAEYQLGLNHSNEVLVPTKVANLSGISKVITSGKGTYFLTQNGDTYVCGNNSYGQLGLSQNGNITKVEKIPNIAGINKIKLCDKMGTVYLTRDSDVYVSGYNHSGRLGMNNTNIVNVLTKIKIIGTAKCKTCTKDAYWKTSETMHMLVCSSDSTHISDIQPHSINDNECDICGYMISRVYQPKFIDFTDTNHWAWRHVGHLCDMGIVKGDIDGVGNPILVPDEPITAEAFIALLARVLGYNGVDNIPNESVYMPITKNSWSIGEWKYLIKYIENNDKSFDAKKEIQILLANNSKNASDEEIARNYKHAITRERAAYLLGIVFGTDYNNYNISDSSKFIDWGEVTSAYKERLLRLAAYEILRGANENGRLYVNPTDGITRVEAVSLIDRMYLVKK